MASADESERRAVWKSVLDDPGPLCDIGSYGKTRNQAFIPLDAGRPPQSHRFDNVQTIQLLVWTR